MLIEKERLWTRSFLMICFISLLIAIPTQMMNSNFSLYVDHLGGTTSNTGFLMMLFSISGIISRMISGYLADKKGRKGILIIGCLMYAAATVFCIFFSSMTNLAVLRFIQGLGFAAASTAASTIAVDVLPKTRLGEGIGYYGSTVAIATAIGPALAVYFVSLGKYALPFWSGAVLLVLAWPLTKLGGIKNMPDKKDNPCEAKKEHDTKLPHKENNLFFLFFEKKALKASIVQFFLSFSIAGIMVFAALYAQQKGYTHIGLFFILVAISMTLTRISTGRFVDRKGALFVLVISLVIGICGFIMLALTSSEIFFLIGGCLYGFANGTAIPSLNALAVKDAAINRRGAASATFYFAMDGGVGVGGLLLGIIAGDFGFALTYSFIAVCMLACLGLCLLFFRKGNSHLKAKG